MERDHVYSDAQYRSRLVGHEISRNVPPIVRLRGCNIEVVAVIEPAGNVTFDLMSLFTTSIARIL